MYRRPIHRPQMVFTVFYHPFSIFSRSGKLFVIIICNVIIICDTIIIFVCGVNSDIYHLSLFCSVIIICGVISTVAEPVCFFTGSIFSAPAPAPIKNRLLTIKKKNFTTFKTLYQYLNEGREMRSEFFFHLSRSWSRIFKTGSGQNLLSQSGRLRNTGHQIIIRCFIFNGL